MQGNSLSEFAVGKNDGGGIIRRGNVSVQDESLPVRLAALKLWPSGMIWQATENPPSDPTAPNQRRWFSLEGIQQSSTIGTSVTKFAPAPSSECSDVGPWVTVPRVDSPSALHRWDAESEEWTHAFGRDGVRAFECIGDGRLLFLTRQGEGRLTDGEQASVLFSSPTHQFTAATRIQGRLHIGGLRGSLLTYQDDQLTTVTEGLRIPLLPRDGLGLGGLADLWVSEDESTAMVIESNNLHRLTSEEPSPFDRKVVNSNGWLREAASSEVWGIDEPRFALSPEELFTRDRWGWERSEYFEALDEFEGVDIAGRSEDAVWLAAEEDLYRYDGETWQRLSGPDTSLRSAIDSRDLTLTRLLVEDSDDTHVAAESRIYELTQDGTEWELMNERTAPCNRVSAMHRGQDGNLWVAGDDTCVARYDGQTWQVFEPTFEWGIPTASVPSDPLTSWEFVRQPGAERPLVVSRPGILQPTADGDLERSYAGNMVDAVYLEYLDVSLVLHDRGILAKYY